MNKLLLTLLTLLTCSTVSAETFQKVTSADDLADGDKIFFIHSTGSQYYYSGTISSNSLNGIAVEGTLDEQIEITDLENVFTVAKSDATFTFTYANGSSLGYGGNSTSVSNISSSASNPANKFSISIATSGLATITEPESERFLGWQGTSSTRWKFYAPSGTNAKPYIYKLVAAAVPGEPIDYTPNFEDISLSQDKEFQLDFGAKHPSVIICVSDNEDVATVTDDGLIKAVAIGDANITVCWEGDDNFTENLDGVTFKVTVTEKVIEPATFTDVLNLTNFGMQNAGSSYDNYTYTSSKGITYTAYIARNGNNMQFNSKNDIGIVVTTGKEGYIVSSITVTLSSGTIDVYGKGAAYSSAADLYDTNKQGSQIASVESTQTITLTDDQNFSFIGFRSKSGASYVSKIEVTWKDAAPTLDDCLLSFVDETINHDIADEFTPQQLNNPQGLENITWTSSEEAVATVSKDGTTFEICGLGSTVITASYAGNASVTSGSASYTLVVSDRNIQMVTFDFVHEDYGMTRHTSGTDYNPDPCSFGNGWIGAVAEGQTRVWSTKGMRTYKGATIKFTAPVNCTITEVSVLNSDDSVNTTRTKDFTNNKTSATYTHTNTTSADLAKVVIYYTGATDEEIANEFKSAAGLSMTVNGNEHSEESFTKTADADAVIKIAHVYPHAKIYCQWLPESEQEVQTMAEDGFMEHTAELKLDRAGQLNYYAELNGHTSAIKTLTVNGPSTTSLVEVEAAAGGEAEWFDLQGRRVAVPANGGVYILRQGSHVSKRML